MRRRLIIFTRYPEPGKTKTRLIPLLGPQAACDLHRQMTEHTLVRVREVQKPRSLSIEVRYEGGSRFLMTQWLGAHFSYIPQGGGGLGHRMARAFSETFERKVEKVVVVGTDCPGLTGGLIKSAFDALERNDVVIGPASDGGYYLIGLGKVTPQLFEGVSWGTEEVLEQTMKIVERRGLSARLLSPLGDVDRPEDLSIWQEEAKPSPTHPGEGMISIIIPTLNEADNISKTLESIRGAFDVEVIVVDGGSRDGTVEMAKSCGAEVLTSAPGRARQMNAGAQTAKGEVLLFLHADTLLPVGFRHYIQETLAQPGTAAGAFELRIDAQRPGLRLIERLANWRSRRIQIPYGDQAIFLRADLFHDIGGFQDIPIMEDVELIQRVRRRGRVMIAPVSAITSARRWLALGIRRTTLINQMAIVAHLLGIQASRIARLYCRK